MSRRTLGSIVTAGGAFLVAWLLWSGHYTPLLLTLGVISCAIVLGLSLRTGFFNINVYSLHLGPRLPAYWLWLLPEIVRANLAVARIVLAPRLAISPTIVRIDASSLPAVVQATLANAITLTPGSLTLDIHGGQIEVHCLTADSAESLLSGEMLRRAAALTGN